LKLRQLPLSHRLAACNFAQQIRVQLGESSQPIWVEFTPTDPEKNLLMKSGVASRDEQ